ncbi:MAG: Holliday junction branch migration protein RuvA [Candidatus Eiseniibacteriota bacterium]
MIARLKGTLVEKSVAGSIVDVGGVGYAIAHSLHTFEVLPAVGSAVTLLTHLHVREDVLQLYGFSGVEERRLFELLLSVSGVGPKVALAVLSGLSPKSLARAIADGNLAALTRVAGVGRKTAERIVIDLRDRVPAVPRGAEAGAGRGAEDAGAVVAPDESGAPGTGVAGGKARGKGRKREAAAELPGRSFEDAVAALTALGLNRSGAIEHVERALQQGPATSIEDLVRRALALSVPRGSTAGRSPSGRSPAGRPGGRVRAGV